MASRTAPQLLEREQELGALDALVSRALGGDGHVLVLEGPAGIGKTRLLMAARARADEAGLRVLRARGDDMERAFSFGVVRQLFEPLIATASAAERAELFAGAAGLARPLFEEAPEESGADQSFGRMHGLYWLTANAADSSPLMLSVDDLHWCDGPSLRFLGYLVRRLEGMPVMVAAALRPAEPGADDELLAAVTGDPQAEIHRPAPLSRDATTELLRETFDRDPEPAFSTACNSVSGGNPLLLHELLGALRAQGVTPRAAEVAAVEEIGPDAVSRSVLRRVRRLPPAAASLARAVAVLGDGASIADAAELAGLDPTTAADAAADLARADILRAGEPLGFVHALVRDASYRELGATEREDLHARAAEVLAARLAAPEEIAAHLLMTPPVGDPETAAVLRHAASLSLAEGAPESAVAYLKRALREPPEPWERTAFLAELGLAAGRLDAPASIEYLTEAAALTADPLERADLARELGRTLWIVGHVDEAVRLFERTLAELPAGSDIALRLEAELAYVCYHAALPVDRGARLVPAEASIREETAGAKMLFGQLALYAADSVRPAPEAVAYARRALDGGLLFQEGAASFHLAAPLFTLVHADEFDEAKAILDAAVEATRREARLPDFISAVCVRSRLLFLRGELVEAEADARTGLDALISHGLVAAHPYACAFLIDALLERGELDEAATVEPAAAAAIVGAGMCQFRTSRARMLALQGRPHDALVDLEEPRRCSAFGASANPAFAPWRAIRARALLDLGETEEARACAAEELELARRWGAPRALGAALRAAGVVEGGETGIALLREAVATLEESPAQLERAKAIIALGGALRRAGQRAEARELLEAGIELAHACGAKPLVDEAREELLATGARPRRLAFSGADALTASERRVARLAAEGKANRDIAQALFVTQKTVEAHLSRAYRKLGIGSRLELATAFGELEPLSSPG